MGMGPLGWPSSGAGRLLAHMEGGGCCIESERAPGTFIDVEDDLALDEDWLFINDRGFDRESGAMVYGNWRGVPYAMRRVAHENGGRRGCLDLSWTMGGGQLPAIARR